MTAKHFEDLWIEAETLSGLHPMSKQELFIKLKYDLDEYIKLDSIPSQEIQNVLKTKKLGEILYRIAELSRTDDINTYAALQMEVRTITNFNQLQVVQE